MTDGQAGPLDGITVLEMGSLIAGSFCCRLLGDMGARVIKVEPPDVGDPLRQWGRVMTESGSLWWLVQSRNKESLLADLRTPEGQEIIRRLIPKVDIVVENFRPGKLEDWGLGPDDLRRCREDVILVRISGFGQTGPWRERPGFGSIAEALGGLRFLTGEANGPPMRVGVSIGDAVAALYAALGACAALRRREKAEVGDVVDVALTDAVFSLLESVLPEYGSEGVVRTRSGNRLNGAAPSNTYLTKDQQWIAIGANGDSIFKRLAALMDMPSLLSDPRFGDNQARCAHVDVLDEVIGRWVGTQDLDELWERLNTAGVPAAPIHDISQIVDNPQFQARGMVQEIDVPKVGAVLMPGMVLRFESGDASIRWAGPELGEHTRDILLTDAGFSEDDLAKIELLTRPPS